MAHSSKVITSFSCFVEKKTLDLKFAAILKYALLISIDVLNLVRYEFTLTVVTGFNSYLTSQLG